jgi:hypothetical protein
VSDMAPTPVQRNLAAVKYLRDRPGQVIHYADVSEGIGEGRTDDKALGRVNAALARVSREYPERGVCREGSGHYVYRPDRDTHPPRRGETPPGPKPGDLFEVVGRVAQTVIVRDPVSFELFRLERWTA